MLQLEGLYRNYGFRKALLPLSLEFSGGQTICVLGPNGAGKSSFLDALLSPPPSDAKIIFHGKALVSDDQMRAYYANIGFVGHDPGLYLDLSCRENLHCFFAHYSLERLPEESVSESLRRAGLLARSDDPARSLSRGMKQRLGLMRSLLHNPDIWLLDEPITGLDLAGQDLLIELLQERNREGKLSIAITHTDEPFLPVANRYLYLNQGALVADIDASRYSSTARQKAKEILRKGVLN
ncbi:MAG: ABC transporter ATP-binding protein [Leptospiraceae bacterium]|nr:ABC transporter ATP-binding protein [Leptospiraceae bacterium]